MWDLSVPSAVCRVSQHAFESSQTECLAAGSTDGVFAKADDHDPGWMLAWRLHHREKAITAGLLDLGRGFSPRW